jgi:hypothetical protein
MDSVLDSDAIHSPNEHFGIFNYLKGNYSVVLQIFCWVKQINVLHINLQNPFSNERIFFWAFPRFRTILSYDTRSATRSGYPLQSYLLKQIRISTTILNATL